MRHFLFHRRKPADARSSAPLLETDQDGLQNARIVDYNSTNRIVDYNSTHSIQHPSIEPIAFSASLHPISSTEEPLTNTFTSLANPSSPNSQLEYTSIGPLTGSYRGGFNTSISHLFVSPSDRTVDCCSLFCCGVLQFEYNRHFLTGGRFKPKSFAQRFLWYIFIPVFAFSLASYFAVHFNDASFSEIASTLLILFSFSWILYLAFKSSMRRGQFRIALIRWLKFHGNKETESDIDVTVVDTEWADDADRPRCPTCVHRSIACYPVDYDDEHDVDSIDRSDWDFCSLSSTYCSKLCCGSLFGCWLQCCGVCALAQEGRQINKLIPPEKRLVDYVTFERYFEYFEHIKKLRMNKDHSIISHFRALSRLSRMLLKTLGMTT